MELKEALMSMDPFDDDQWTGEGLPKVDFVASLIEGNVTRKDITEAAPQFTRENMEVEVVNPDADNDAGDPDPDADNDADDPDPDADKEEVVGVMADEDLLEAYLNGDPLNEREAASFARELSDEGLPIFETILIEQATKIDEEISKLETMKGHVKVSLAYTRANIKARIPDKSNQEAIQDFIKAQAEQRGARIEATRELLKGVDLKSLDPRSAIDRAMARKTARGGKRPTRSLM
jgi:hypothetical protein